MSFISAYCFTQAFHSHSFINSLWKWTGRIVSNSLFLRELTFCYNRLWEFSVTKLICYKDVFVNSFCSSTFRSANSLVVEPFLESSLRRCSLRKSVLRNFTKFTGKQLCQSLFFNKVAGLRFATLLKKRLWHISGEISKNIFFTEHLWETASVSFDLLSKQLLNLELIPSSQRQNDNGDVYVFGNLWTLTTS